MQEYLLAIEMITASITSITEMPKAILCPRCRRAAPKGPKKQPNPTFPSARPKQGVKNENR
jgi:hypothetical protein